jgi:hypothetical protein
MSVCIFLSTVGFPTISAYRGRDTDFKKDLEILITLRRLSVNGAIIYRSAMTQY